MQANTSFAQCLHFLGLELCMYAKEKILLNAVACYLLFRVHDWMRAKAYAAKACAGLWRVPGH